MPFIPQSDKEFSLPEGSLAIGYNKGRNAYNVIKVLKIEKAELKKGDVRTIINQRITMPEDDFFLIVAVSMTEFIYPTFEEAKKCIAENNINWKFMHLPMRPSGWRESNLQLAGHAVVTEEELQLYHEWKDLFDKAEAGVW